MQGNGRQGLACPNPLASAGAGRSSAGTPPPALPAENRLEVGRRFAALGIQRCERSVRAHMKRSTQGVGEGSGIERFSSAHGGVSSRSCRGKVDAAPHPGHEKKPAPQGRDYWRRFYAATSVATRSRVCYHRAGFKGGGQSPPAMHSPGGSGRGGGALNEGSPRGADRKPEGCSCPRMLHCP